MIHTVKMPEQDAKWLQEILCLQLALLGIAVEGAIGEDGSELRAGLNNIPEYTEHADEIADWVCRKWKTLFADLQTFAAHNDANAKVVLHCQISHDLDLLTSPESAQLQAVFDKNAEDWKRAIGRFLYQWYDTWSKSGLDHYLFQTRSEQQGKYSRQDFVGSFIGENSHLYCCPICDAGAYRSETSKGVYTSIDHFFPRSRYPHLALHPYNLLPMCAACNSGEAGPRDPLANGQAVADLILPYHHRGIGGRTYIKIEFRPVMQDEKAGGGNHQHALKISFQPAEASNEEESIAVETIRQFEAIYSVEARWNNERNLTLIDEHVFRRIRQFLFGDVQRGEPVNDPHFLRGRLQLLMALVDRESMGQDPFSFVSVWWLMWQVQRLESHKPLDVNKEDECQEMYKALVDSQAEPIVSELSYWACEQQKGFEELRRRVAILEARVPVIGGEATLAKADG